MSKGKEYIAISPFRDLKDYKQFPNGREYAIGDAYSKEERIDELSTNKNKLKRPVIKLNEIKVKTDEKTKEAIKEFAKNKLDDLTAKELKEMAKEKEVDNYPTMKKEELVKALDGE